jgi:hypothetical protein
MGSVQLAFFGIRVCETCGEAFQPKGRQKFCTRACGSRKHRPMQIPVSLEEVRKVRELVRDNLDHYYQWTGAVQGPCGALAKVLSRHGWGRIACGYYGFSGQNPDQLNAAPPLVEKDSFGEIVGFGEGEDNWRAHWVNVNKFVGVIDVSGAYLEHPLAVPMYREGHLVVTDSIVGLRTGKPIWSKQEVEFWEAMLAPILYTPTRRICT